MKPEKKLAGLNLNKDGYWQLDKRISGNRLFKSTGKKNYAEAERIAIKWIHEAEQQAFYGHAQKITFRQAATIYLETETKKSLKNDDNDLRKIMPYIGDLLLDEIHNKTLDKYKHDQLTTGGKDGTGAKGTTVNRSLRTLSRVLKLAANEWRDDNNKAYLSSPPIIRMVSEHDKTITRPIEHFEEKMLLAELMEKWQDLWLFATHTGLREQTQCHLQWDWERTHAKINSVMFVIPAQHLKYGKKIGNGSGGDWLLVLNSKASAIIEKWRGRNDVYVFPNPHGKPFSGLNGKHFNNTKKKLNLTGLNWHSARSTFATNLRVAGVSEEDRSYLMAHNTGSITTQYSWADINHLANCVEKLCEIGEDTEETLFSLGSLRKPTRR